jgi:uncharacterized protein YbjT (DUF2867 family)
MILITGAAGKTGQAIIQTLVGQNQVVRGLVRGQEQASALEELGVRETIIGDMLDKTIVDQAAQGISAIYHICPNMHPQETLIGEIAISAARSAAVEHFVYHSVLHPQIEAMAHHWQKLRVEEKLFESRLAFTILQPAAYMQNVLANWDRIVDDGIYAVPYALDTRISMVDIRDVAEVAATVLLNKGHEEAIYELSGPEALSQREVAATLGAQLGRPIKAETVASEIWEQQARSAGMSDYAVETLIKMFQHYEQYDFRGNPQVLGWLLGRSPTTFAQFIRKFVEESPNG